MDDTRPEMKDRVRANLMARSPAERLAMASRMAVGARKLAEAGVRATLGPDASDRDVRRAVFLRFYGRDLGDERALAIFDALEARRVARRSSAG